MGQEKGWRPLTRAQFQALERGQELRDRQGRTWTVTAAPFQDQGRDYIVVRCGDNVRRVEAFFASEFALAE